MHMLGLRTASFLAAVLLASVPMSNTLAQHPGASSIPSAAWPTSPFHGVTSGATGQAIPCRCRFQGSAYGLGDTVCMNTHLGMQLARCDFMLNNTSWVPIGVPCAMSRLGTRSVVR